MMILMLLLPDVDDQIFDFEYQLDASFGSIDDVSVYTMEVRDPYGDGFLYKLTATTLIILILQLMERFVSQM